MKTTLLHAVTASLLFAGCTGTYRAEVTTPSMVAIDGDVQVIADVDEPVFYTDRYYWRESGGVWYRSSRHNGGWTVYSAPPQIRRIERPSAYVRYRGPANATRNHDNNRPDHKNKNDRKDHDRNHKD